MREKNKNVIVPISEKSLFYRVALGDEAAFTSLFKVYLGRLHPFILRFTKSELAAQEIIQETFIRVWLSRDKLSDVENHEGWLFKVASNECYNYLRKAVVANRFSYAIAGEPDPVDTTNEWLDSIELKRLVHEAVSSLPPQRKRIYQMSRDEGKTIAEIANTLNISPNTVKNTLVISLKSIRDFLAKHGVTFYLWLVLFKKG